jgi:hypothetical protein
VNRRKNINSSEIDIDEELITPLYNELVDLLKEHIKVIRKIEQRIKNSNKSLLAKYDSQKN